MIRRRTWNLTLFALGVLHAWLAVSVSDRQGATADEAFLAALSGPLAVDP